MVYRTDATHHLRFSLYPWMSGALKNWKLPKGQGWIICLWWHLDAHAVPGEVVTIRNDLKRSIIYQPLHTPLIP